MEYEKILISSDISIENAIKKLDETSKQILIVVNSEKILLGVITDGDIRRWILKSGELKESVDKIMNTNPTFIFEKDFGLAKNIIMEKAIAALPILDDDKKIINIVFWNDHFNKPLANFKKISNPIVIMAGGKGSRLKPITNIIPKPLVPIGEITIVERIINEFKRYGAENFYMTINFKKEMIKAYFQSLSLNYRLNFIEEEKFLGTAGGLFYLKNVIKETFFVSNCDILINSNYYKILKYHRENKNQITIVTSLKKNVIPYGVIKLAEDGSVKNIIEKPEQEILINTGMYVLEPECLEDIPENKFFHLTDLINNYLNEGKKVGIFPISENSWSDMGEFEEMKKMINEFRW